MIRCSEINNYIRAGVRVFAKVPGIEGLVEVLQARVGQELQVRIHVDGGEVWRSVHNESIRVEGRGL